MVMKKYRSEFESNRVLTELKFILENFQDIHIEFFKVRTGGRGTLDIPPPLAVFETFWTNTPCSLSASKLKHSPPMNKP